MYAVTERKQVLGLVVFSEEVQPLIAVQIIAGFTHRHAMRACKFAYVGHNVTDYAPIYGNRSL